jgi:hypothetical protein
MSELSTANTSESTTINNIYSPILTLNSSASSYNTINNSKIGTLSIANTNAATYFISNSSISGQLSTVASYTGNTTLKDTDFSGATFAISSTSQNKIKMYNPYNLSSYSITGITSATIYNPPEEGPLDYGYLAWAYSTQCTPAQTVPATGTVNLIRIKVTQPITISNVYTFATLASGTISASNSFVGIYSSTGPTNYTLIQGSNDLSSVYSTFPLGNGLITLPLSAPVRLDRGYYYIGILVNYGTGTPNFNRLVSSFFNNRYPVAPQFPKYNRTFGTGFTSLPSSITSLLGIGSASVFSFWAAVA